jgi:hypothetical protein
MVGYGVGLLWLVRLHHFHRSWQWERHGHARVVHQSYGLVELMWMQDGLQLLSAPLEKSKKGQ